MNVRVVRKDESEERFVIQGVSKWLGINFR
jgi:hypothetical protein